MTLSPVHRLVVAYAVLWALLEVAVHLPGNLTSTFWGSVGRLAIGALIVWGLWRGSRAAWVIGFVVAASTVLSMFLFLAGGPMNTADTWLVATCIAQVAVLCTPPLFGFVWSRETSQPR
jgi:hypothetical protein